MLEVLGLKVYKAIEFRKTLKQHVLLFFCKENYYSMTFVTNNVGIFFQCSSKIIQKYIILSVMDFFCNI